MLRRVEVLWKRGIMFCYEAGLTLISHTGCHVLEFLSAEALLVKGGGLGGVFDF